MLFSHNSSTIGPGPFLGILVLYVRFFYGTHFLIFSALYFKLAKISMNLCSIFVIRLSFPQKVKHTTQGHSKHGFEHFSFFCFDH